MMQQSFLPYLFRLLLPIKAGALVTLLEAKFASHSKTLGIVV